MVPIDVPLLGDDRHKNWAKVVTNVDESLATGWAFEGEFIATGGVQDVPAGSVVLVYGERGSRTRPQIAAQVLVVHADGTASVAAEAKGRAWARTLRDRVVELLEEQRGAPVQAKLWDPVLMQYTTEALESELARRSQR